LKQKERPPPCFPDGSFGIKVEQPEGYECVSMGMPFMCRYLFYSLLLNICNFFSWSPGGGGGGGLRGPLLLLNLSVEKPSFSHLQYDSTDLRKRCFSSGTSRLARAVSTLSFLKNFGLNSIWKVHFFIPFQLYIFFMYWRPILCTLYGVVDFLYCTCSEEIHYVPIGDGWREVLVCNVLHYIPVLLSNHHL
jgi:hypothetical protein